MGCWTLVSKPSGTTLFLNHLNRGVTVPLRYFSNTVDDRQKKLMARSLPKRVSIPNVQSIVVVASGKGGVGKSTTASNLAVSLAGAGQKVGLLDADIFGPSIPLLMNLREEPAIDSSNKMIPVINYNVKCMSMGLLVDASPVVWRGPLVMSAVQRLLRGTNWGELDTLIVDTPPGTGDVHLTLHQQVPIAGVLLVSTPQLAALQVTHRGAEMYSRFSVPVIGLVENMSFAVCSNCSHKTHVFGKATDAFVREHMKTSVIAQIPMEEEVMRCSDLGTPHVLVHPGSSYALAFNGLAEKILRFLAK